MEEERVGAATYLGSPLTLVGTEITVGDQAPDFEVVTSELVPYSLKDGHGEVRVIASLASVDTPVCDLEIRRLSKAARELGNLRFVVVSADLPFAQARWLKAQGIDNATALSDHRELAFGRAFGVAIKELRILSRALFILDPNDRVSYVEYVKELADHPDYDALLGAIKRAA